MGLGAATVPVKEISPRRSGAWEATSRHPQARLRLWRLAKNNASRATANVLILSNWRAELP